MISEKEIVGSKIVPPELRENLNTLLERVNRLRKAWNKPMVVTSGYRSMEEHRAIYERKGVAQSKVPLHSKHLYCQAVDIADPDGKLKAYVKANKYKVLIDCELYMEAESATPNWLHIQIVPPNSGKREFNP